MKKVILLLFCLFSLQVNSFAQTAGPGGDCQITNLTDCDVTWDMVAICPGATPCTEYSTGAHNLLLAGAPSLSYTPITYPWSLATGAPPCTNPIWEWAYAWVSVHCSGGAGNPVKVGFYSCAGALPGTGWKIPLCDCGGKTVYAEVNYLAFGSGLTNLVFKY